MRLKKLQNVVRLIREWLVYLAVTLVLYYFFWYLIDNTFSGAQDKGWGMFMTDLFYACFFSLLMVGVCRVAEGMFRRENMSRPLAVSVTISVALMSVAFTYGFEVVMHKLAGNNRIIPGGELFVYSLVGAALSAHILMSRYYRLHMDLLRHNRQLSVALLQRQLDPHFMFNNLSTLAGLIEPENKAAHEFLTRFAQIYRRICKHLLSNTTTIRESVMFIEDYFALLEVRHPRHFRVTYSRDMEDREDRVPAMALQLLVENAVKHNRHSADYPLQIWMESEKDYFVVRNSLSPYNTFYESERTGLENLNERCLSLCGRPLVLNRDSEYFEVKIPVVSRNVEI